MSFSRLVTAIAVVTTAIVVAACGPVPKPFQQNDNQKASFELVRPDQARSLMVEVPLMEPPATTFQLGDSLKREFEGAGIPVTFRTDRTDAPLLVGSIWPTADGLGARWELFGPDSDLISVVVVQDLPSPDNWGGDTMAIADRIASQVVAETLSSLRPSAGRLRPLFDPSVFVADTTGASGDGNEALQRAAVNALDRAGIRRTDNRESADLILYAVVKVVSLDADTDAVRIRWLMEDQTGARIGRLTQQNLVAAGSLQKRWGLAAFDAAEAIAEPVGDALLTLNANSASTENQNQ